MTKTQIRIGNLARTVMAIEAQQVDHPGYCEDEAEAIINAELKRLWRESYGVEFSPVSSKIRRR